MNFSVEFDDIPIGYMVDENGVYKLTDGISFQNGIQIVPVVKRKISEIPIIATRFLHDRQESNWSLVIKTIDRIGKVKLFELPLESLISKEDVARIFLKENINICLNPADLEDLLHYIRALNPIL